MRVDVYEICIKIFLVCVVFGLCAFLFVSMMYDLKTVSETARETTTETSSILSIAYRENVSGQFVLGTGMVSGQEYYTCYERLEDGGIVLLKLNAETTVIYQSLNEGEEAYVEKEVTKYGSVISAKLYVPTNTIQKEYNLDLAA